MACVKMKKETKVLGINCSPRKDGNSNFLLEKVLEGAKKNGCITKKINIADYDISPCSENEYNQVSEEGLSIVNDDANKIIEEVCVSDILIIASPIFFGSLSAQAKTIIDRFQCVWLNKNVFHNGKDFFSSRKKGYFLSTSATDRDDFFDNAKSIIRHFFAVINCEYSGEIFCKKAEKKNDICEYPEVVEAACILGSKIKQER